MGQTRIDRQFDQCGSPLQQVSCLGPQPLVDMASGRHQSVSRLGSDSLAAVGSQPDRLAAGVYSRAVGITGRGNGPLQPHQPCLSSVEGVHVQRCRPGRPRTPACWERGRSPISRPSLASTSRFPSTRVVLGFCRATTSRVPAVWVCRWWPSDCSTTRGISSSTWIASGYQNEEYIDTKVANLPMNPALSTRRGSDHGQHHDAGRHALGQGVADAGGARQAVPVGLRRGRKQSAGPRVDVATLWWRRAHADSPGVGAGRRRCAGA